MFPRVSWIVVFSLSLSLAMLAGCNRGPDLVPVRGKVTLDGKPLEGAAVMFHPQSGGRPASGETNAVGVFALTTVNENDGTVPGHHIVTVALTKMSRQLREDEPWDESAVEHIVPARYSNPKTSDLSADVARGMDPVELKLTSQEIGQKPFPAEANRKTGEGTSQANAPEE